MAICKSRCNFYFKVQRAADLGRCGPVNQQYFTPSPPADPEVLARSGPGRPGRAPVAAPTGVLQAGLEVAATCDDHPRPGRNLVAHPPGCTRGPASVLRNSHMQHQAIAYRGPRCFREPQSPLLRPPSPRCPGPPSPRCPGPPSPRCPGPPFPLPHCFREPPPPGRRDSRPSRMCRGQRHHARYRFRPCRRPDAPRPSVNQPSGHGICVGPISTGHMSPPGHYSACVTTAPDAVIRTPHGAKICPPIAANGPHRDA
jgi:hypothetical protein